MNLFGHAFFVKDKKVVLSRLNLFVLKKNKKDFKQTAPSLMQKCDNISYFGQMDTNLIINL